MIEILGGGPAGAAAALYARQSGASVRIWEKSIFPRQKVCGEFLSPEVLPVLERAGILPSFEALRPARITRVNLVFRNRDAWSRLPATAWGLSRFALDHWFLQHALDAGAHLQRATAQPATVPPPAIHAFGRRVTQSLPKGTRLFGFKAHFQGPVNDAVELYFFAGGYVGVNPVEGGSTNVCGLAREDLLQRIDFDIDHLLASQPALSARTRPLTRAFPWLRVGPLVYGNSLHQPPESGIYPAGDALSFVDPFTGSGQLSAILTGSIAGTAAAHRWSPQQYRDACARAIGRPFWFSSLFREAIVQGWADLVGGWVPAGFLYRLTRPRALS
jgi:flavin-dependent dehydrogenase